MPGRRAELTRKRFAPNGFTLLELVLMLAIVAVLASLVAPMAVGMLRDADRARAEADVQQLATALTRFYGDLKRLPACAGDDCSRIGSPNGDLLAFLAVGEGDGGLSRWYPAEQPGLTPRWDLRANDHPSRAARNNAFNHLIRNDPNADGVVDGADYPRARPGWQGPYVSSLGRDPWGHAYIMAVGALRSSGPRSPGARAWILSAGPNGRIETPADAISLGGDDVGLIFDDRRSEGRPPDLTAAWTRDGLPGEGRERDDARVPGVPAH